MSKDNQSSTFNQAEQKQLHEVRKFMADQIEFAKGSPDRASELHRQEIKAIWLDSLTVSEIYPAVAQHILDHCSEIVSLLIARGTISILAVDISSFEKIVFLLAQAQSEKTSSYMNFMNIRREGLERFPEAYKKHHNFIEEGITNSKGLFGY